ncbi:transposon Tf2-11 polyprotein [Nephila pilipes]|uniref:Transposon Tf2-11 polyprotein n=1 Tax=Nephila pilipes TaxID=299642 RepID=A0A8X6PP24_NEPPI|nr:transposon Tf2-11 polyprotein [Nephila pilipes]
MHIKRYQIYMFRSCVSCQQAKKMRHKKSPIGPFVLPDANFAHIHIDFIGTPSAFEGIKYCRTIINIFSGSAELIPTSEMTAETTARALMHVWITKFGCPVTIIFD